MSVVYLFILGVVAVVSIGLAFAVRRAERRSELNRWSRASQYLNDICPPADATATLWCRLVDEQVPVEAAEVAASAQVASLEAVASREIPIQPVRQSGADAA